MAYSSIIFILTILGTVGVMWRTISDHRAKILVALDEAMPSADASDFRERGYPGAAASPRCAAV